MRIHAGLIVVLGLLVVGCNKKSQRTKDTEAADENGRQELERMKKGNGVVGLRDHDDEENFDRPTSKPSGQNSATEKQLKIGDVVGTYERKTVEKTSRLVLKGNGEGHILRVGGTARVPTTNWTIEGDEVFYHALDGTFIFVYTRNSDKSLSHIADIYGSPPRRFKREEVHTSKKIK